MIVMTDGYRPAVGVMLLNEERKVWVGQRLDNSLEAWQMPQGGLDEGEEPLEGALRELEEETGISRDLVELIAQAKEELTYDLPADLVGKVWKKNWRGQRQTWFLMRFLGAGRGREYRDGRARISRLEMGRAGRASGDDRAVQAAALPRRAAGLRGVALGAAPG